MLDFDAETHTYRYNGAVVPGVTTVLEPLSDFSFVAPDVMQAACEFGTAVHLACELDDKGELDVDALDPALLPYLTAWRKFSEDFAVKWSFIEERVHNKTMGYAGTLDRLGLVKNKLTVVDLKTSAALHPSVGPQLAAYAKAHPQTATLLIKRLAVLLKENGTYKAQYYDDPTDWPLFCSLLTLRQWCSKHHITPKFESKT